LFPPGNKGLPEGGLEFGLSSGSVGNGVPGYNVIKKTKIRNNTKIRKIL
jgi:hypothetical protein